MLECYTFLRIGGSSSRTILLPCEQGQSRSEVIEQLRTFHAETAQCSSEDERQHLLGVIEEGHSTLEKFNASVHAAIGLLETSPNKQRIRVFGSMRFGVEEVHRHEGPALKEELAKHGIDLFIASPNAGSDITQEVFDAMSKCEAFIAFATSTYAEDTGNPASTYKELNYWQTRMQLVHPNRLIPIKMLQPGEAFDVERKGVRAADVLFNSNLAYVSWPAGSTRTADGETSVPHYVVTKLLKVLLWSDDGKNKELLEESRKLSMGLSSRATLQHDLLV